MCFIAFMCYKIPWGCLGLHQLVVQYLWSLLHQLVTSLVALDQPNLLLLISVAHCKTVCVCVTCRHRYTIRYVLRVSLKLIMIIIENTFSYCDRNSSHNSSAGSFNCSSKSTHSASFFGLDYQQKINGVKPDPFYTKYRYKNIYNRIIKWKIH